jgi:hypothetical protein
VTWQSPINNSELVASDNTGGGGLPDADPVAAGWQGSLSVCTNVDVATYPGATVQFAADGVDLGAAVPLDAGGCAELLDATVPEGARIALSATTSDIDGEVGEATINVVVDVTPPGAVSALNADVDDRRATSFLLSWDVASGEQAAGYEVRVATEVIDTAENFDAAESVPFTGVPAASGSDSITVESRIIETDYFFAIAAVDEVGNRGAFAHTPADAPARAPFEVVELTPSVAETFFGYAIDGSADLDGDGFSDVVIGSLAGNAVSVRFGSSDGLDPSRVLTITGQQPSFGYDLAVVGDVNGDTWPDFGIGSWRDEDGKAFVYYGYGDGTWPTTLTQSDADVVIAPNASSTPFSGAYLGMSIAGIGDFNGDGVDDFAVGSPLYNDAVVQQGHVTIVLGQAGGLADFVTVPDAYGTSAIGIDGDSTQSSIFGYKLMGMGRFYASTLGETTLVVAGPYAGSNAGVLYAFKGDAAMSGRISVADALDSYTGQAATYTGINGFGLMGGVGPGGRAALVVGVPRAAPSGKAMVLSGAQGQGPFTSVLASLITEEGGSDSDFGRMALGGGYSGTAAPVSFLGSPTSDLVVSTRVGGNPRLFFVDGDRLGEAGAADSYIEDIADLVYPLAGTWTDFVRNVTPLRDIDGDGYADIAVADTSYGDPVDGRVVILH